MYDLCIIYFLFSFEGFKILGQGKGVVRGAFVFVVNIGFCMKKCLLKG